MKVFNSSNVVNLSLNDSQITKTWDKDCTHVIYDSDFQEILKQWTPDHLVSNFISSQNYQKDHLLEGEISKAHAEYVITFRDEKVTEVSDRIRDYLSRVSLDKTFGDIQNYLTLIGTELVQNALIYQRIRNVQNDIELKIAVNESEVQIHVTDPYGSLELDHILSKLKRCIIDGTYEEKREGAGLGLFMVSKSCDKMIINVVSGRKTCVSCIINRYQRLKQYKSKNISFHYLKEQA